MLGLFCIGIWNILSLLHYPELIDEQKQTDRETGRSTGQSKIKQIIFKTDYIRKKNDFYFNCALWQDHQNKKQIKSRLYKSPSFPSTAPVSKLLRGKKHSHKICFICSIINILIIMFVPCLRKPLHQNF